MSFADTNRRSSKWQARPVVLLGLLVLPMIGGIVGCAGINPSEVEAERIHYSKLFIEVEDATTVNSDHFFQWTLHLFKDEVIGRISRMDKDLDIVPNKAAADAVLIIKIKRISTSWYTENRGNTEIEVELGLMTYPDNLPWLRRTVGRSYERNQPVLYEEDGILNDFAYEIAEILVKMGR